VRFAFWLSHKKIVVTGRQHIPKRKPIIFAPNHQNALMDPLAIACTNPYQTIWLARADIFNSKTVRPILKYLKLIPIYRIRDGKENLSNNELVFSEIAHILENKQSIALFPEAAHSGKRQMLPHRKAIPRMALQAEDQNNFNLDLQIIPVGIYYTHYWDFNRTIIVNYGRPIGVDNYKEDYSENPQKAMVSLRDEIYNRLAPLTIQIDSNTYYKEYENICDLTVKAYSRLRYFNKNSVLQYFYAERELIGKIEHLENTQPELFEELIDKTTEYFKEISLYGLTDEQVHKAGETRWLRLFTKLLVALLSLPLFIFGCVFNALPFFIPRIITPRIVKDTAFLSTFQFVIGLIVFPLFYLLTTSLLFFLTGSVIISIITLVLMPFGGKIAFQFLSIYHDILLDLKFQLGNRATKNRIHQLLNQRDNLIKLVLEKVNI
jgi:1-acyl-sn-glycerol-3-phosphate acyltransferase